MEGSAERVGLLPELQGLPSGHPLRLKTWEGEETPGPGGCRLGGQSLPQSFWLLTK